MTGASHWNTPAVTSHDARGLAVRHIAYCRNVTNGALEPLVTRQTCDVIGRPIEQRDARLADTPTPNLKSVYGLGEHPVMIDSVDAGKRLSLEGLAGEKWLIGPARGDCNDYAVTKRHALLQKGVPSRSLRLSVVKTASGIGHLVLVVATTRGPLVLDNLANTIRPWHVTDYHWLKIQSADNANYWYDIAPMVGNSSRARARVAQISQR